MRPSNAILSLVPLALAIAACDDGPSDDFTVADAFEAMVETACSKAFDCEATFPASPAEFTVSFGLDEADCVTMYNALAPVAETQASVSAGRILFDGDAAQACVAALAAVPCTDYWNTDLDPSCDIMFAGQVPQNGSCTIDLDCAVETNACAGDSMTCRP